MSTLTLPCKFAQLRGVFKDPDVVRERCLDIVKNHSTQVLDAGNSNLAYPGLKSRQLLEETAPDIPAELIQNIGSVLLDFTENPHVSTKTWAQVHYPEVWEEEPHQDFSASPEHNEAIVVITYLSKDPPRGTGTTIYAVRGEGLDTELDNDARNRVFSGVGTAKDRELFNLHKNQFDISMSFENEYNKSIVYHPKVFHSSSGSFGIDVESGRLTLMTVISWNTEV